MMNSLFLNVRILSLSAPVFEGEAQACQMPTPEGLTKILPRHMPVVGRLSAGTIQITHEDGAKTSHQVKNGGFYSVTADSAHIWLH